ncbi:MAG: flagellar biosynthetic protein FliO [Alphaproteobacteria bacterium]
MDSVGGELAALLKMIAALIFVLGLMGGLALLLKKLGLSGRVAAAGGKARLKVVESIPLDSRRRLVLLQRDGVQHLVIFGPNGETVVETGIASVDNEV